MPENQQQVSCYWNQKPVMSNPFSSCRQGEYQALCFGKTSLTVAIRYLSCEVPKLNENWQIIWKVQLHEISNTDRFSHLYQYARWIIMVTIFWALTLYNLLNALDTLPCLWGNWATEELSSLLRVTKNLARAYALKQYNIAPKLRRVEEKRISGLWYQEKASRSLECPKTWWSTLISWAVSPRKCSQG